MGVRPRSRSYLKRREEVLKVASRLINSEGLANATLSAVADELGVRHNTLYHYFKDRKELHRTALYRTLELQEASLDVALAADGGSIEKLAAFLRLELGAEPDTRVAPAGGRGLSGAERKRFLQRKMNVSNRIAGLIDEGVSEGSIAPCDALARSFALEAIIGRFLTPNPVVSKRAPSGRVASQVVDALVNGLLVPGKKIPEVEPDDREISQILGLELDPDDADGRELSALLGNAARCFNEQGWDAAVPRMAARLNKSKTVYYQIAEDKQELLFHCLSRGVSLIGASQRAAGQNSSSPTQAIVVHYDYLYRAHDSALGPLPLFNELDRLRPQHRRLVSVRAKSLRMRAERRVSDSIASGWLREFPPRLVQNIFGATLWDLEIGAYCEEGGHQFADVARENLRMVFEGLAAR